MNTLSHRLRNKTLGVALVLTALVAMQPEAFAQPQFTLLHSFNGTDGFGPMAGVMQGADGALYGTTRGQDGSANLGTVFRLDPATLDLTTLHAFAGADGSTLYSGLSLGSDGLLYGSTYSGGGNNLGTLFRVGPDGQNFASLHSFDGTDGAMPDDLKLLQGPDGAFYGATSVGGPDGGGTLFRFDAATQELTTFHSFAASGPDGVDAGLVGGRDHYWYGTTYSGGAAGAGSVFRVDPTTSPPTLTTLHDFTGPDGQYPVPGALMQGTDGNLYGTTQLGGYGTVFKLNPTTLAFTTLHTFSALNDGRWPLGGVTESSDGYLYGTTVLGGQGYGTVYRVHPTTLAYNIVVRFGGPNGRSPSGTLLGARDGSLYGVTRLGGDFNGGTIFRLSLGAPPPPSPLALALSPLVTAEIGVLYDAPLVTGGVPDYTVTLTNGAFPAGLSAHPKTGYLSGTPILPAKPAQFTIEVTDSLGASVTGTFKLKTVKTVEIHTRRLEPGKTGKAYKKTLSAEQGMKPFTWALIAGTLPGGLSFDPATGVISGVPTEAGSATLTFLVTDSLGGQAQNDMTVSIK